MTKKLIENDWYCLYDRNWRQLIPLLPSSLTSSHSSTSCGIGDSMVVTDERYYVFYSNIGLLRGTHWLPLICDRAAIKAGVHCVPCSKPSCDFCSIGKYNVCMSIIWTIWLVCSNFKELSINSRPWCYLFSTPSYHMVSLPNLMPGVNLQSHFNIEGSRYLTWYLLHLDAWPHHLPNNVGIHLLVIACCFGWYQPSRASSWWPCKNFTWYSWG